MIHVKTLRSVLANKGVRGLAKFFRVEEDELLAAFALDQKCILMEVTYVHGPRAHSSAYQFFRFFYRDRQFMVGGSSQSGASNLVLDLYHLGCASRSQTTKAIRSQRTINRLRRRFARDHARELMRLRDEAAVIHYDLHPDGHWTATPY